ncbi:MAG: hypothetical protein HZA50_00735 [Planctomycetes bacterium]|nr:hypothetical protein [Planctomycetota bacterium]
MNADRQNARRNVGLVLLACAVFSAAAGLIRDWDARQAEADPSVQDARFGPLRQKLFELRDAGQLRRENGAIKLGYLTDIPTDSDQMAKLYKTNYYMAIYALAPFLVDDSTGHELVVGNFSRDQIDPGLLREKKLEIECRFGRGVFLLRRADAASREAGR